MPIPIPNSSDRDPVFHIEGALVISEAEAWRNRMAAQFAGTADITIDLGRATAFDLFGLQLLWAVRRSAESAGRAFQLLNAPETFSRCCALAGLAATAFDPLPRPIS